MDFTNNLFYLTGIIRSFNIDQFLIIILNSIFVEFSLATFIKHQSISSSHVHRGANLGIVALNVLFISSNVKLSVSFVDISSVENLYFFFFYLIFVQFIQDISVYYFWLLEMIFYVFIFSNLLIVMGSDIWWHFNDGLCHTRNTYRRAFLYIIYILFRFTQKWRVYVPRWCHWSIYQITFSKLMFQILWAF